VSAPPKINTSTSVSASASQITAGAGATFSARVAPASGSGTPSGTVLFLDGGAQIGSATLAAGTAQFTTTSLAAGSHSVTASYPGDANYSASTSAATTVTVAAAPTGDFSLAMSSSSLTVATGGESSLSLTVTPENGFKQMVSFSCSGLPAGAECGFNPQNLTPSGSAVSTTLQVEVHATNDARPGVSSQSSMLSFPAPGQTPLSISILIFTGIFGLIGISQKSKSFVRVVSTLALGAAMLVTASCAGTVGPKPPPPNATSYTVTVTAAAASGPMHMQTFTLTVTQ